MGMVEVVGFGAIRGTECFEYDNSICIGSSTLEEFSEWNNCDNERLSEHQATDNESLSSDEEKATASDTSTGDLLSSENEEILDDEMTTQVAIYDTMIEVTGEMVEHEKTAHMEDNISENQQNDMYIENEHNENLPHVTTSFEIVQIWICMVLFRIYFKFKLTKAALLSICGLISILLHHIAHPLCNMFPTTFHNLYKVVRSSKMEKTAFIVCPYDACNHLYKPNELNHAPISFMVKGVVVN